MRVSNSDDQFCRFHGLPVQSLVDRDGAGGTVYCECTLWKETQISQHREHY